MTLQSSGQISMSDINVELGYSSTNLITLDDLRVRSLAGKASGVISLYDFYGKSLSSDAINGEPWRLQYPFNTTQTASNLTGWSTNSYGFPIKVYHARAAVTNQRVFVIGGFNSSYNCIATVYTTTIDSLGVLGSWTTATALPAARAAGIVVILKNKLYYIGGAVSISAVSNVVYVATINTDGTLGAWSTTNSLAVGVWYSSAIVTKNRIYLLGGATTPGTASTVATVQTASIDSEGNIGSWATTTSLPVTLAGSRSIKTNGYVYLLGVGETASGGSQTTVYKAPINSDGTLGSWTTSVALPSASYGHMAVATSSRVYVFAYEPLYVMYSATINSDGTLGSWTTGTAMSFRQGHSACVLTSSRLYLIGGRDNGTIQARVSYVSFSGGLNNYLNSSYS